MDQDQTINRRAWLMSAAASGAMALPTASVFGAQSVIDQSDPGLFNVMGFGAKGDSKADDTDAIQRAIDAAQKFERGGIVFLPTGSYLVSKTLLITGRIKIIGQGQATIDGATHIVPASLSFDVIKAVDVMYGVVLEGFTIRGYTDQGQGGHFLRFQGCQHVRVNGVGLSNFWNGVLIDSSGDVFLFDMSLGAVDAPGEGRFGVKCTAASKGNANAAQAWNCTVSQSGKTIRTVDGFVLANGYNSLLTINSGALGCNRAFWTTADGGQPPNFLVVHLGASDHCNTAVQLDDGSFNQFNSLCVTSSEKNNIIVGKNIGGPVGFSNCIITTSGGVGYRIASEKGADVAISGGSVNNISGNAVEISGNANTIISGMSISRIQGGKGPRGADGINISGDGNTTLAGLTINQTRNIAIRVLSTFKGTLNFTGLSQQNANRGLFDEGSPGLLLGSGSFLINFVMDVDVSRNTNPRTCIQSHTSVPAPANPTPSVPASEQEIRNTTGTNCMVYVTASTVHEVILDGVKIGPQRAVYLPVNRKIAVKYTGQLSWNWQRVT